VLVVIIPPILNLLVKLIHWNHSMVRIYKGVESDARNIFELEILFFKF
jgi:hypothetical protein